MVRKREGCKGSCEVDLSIRGELSLIKFIGMIVWRVCIGI